jgi:hypothetical protein
VKNFMGPSLRELSLPFVVINLSGSLEYLSARQEANFPESGYSQTSIARDIPKSK